MARSLEEIADDLAAIEQVLKNNAHAMIQTVAQLAGTTLPADIPDPRALPLSLGLPDGRNVELADIAAELREHAHHTGDFRER